MKNQNVSTICYYELVQPEEAKKIPFWGAQWFLNRLGPTVAQINPTTVVYKRSVGYFLISNFKLFKIESQKTTSRGNENNFSNLN